MMSDFLVKRLLKQAGVSVFAGLMMSSAVWAEDIADTAIEGDVEIDVSIDNGESNEPDVTLDPIEWEGEVVEDDACIDCSGIPDEDVTLTSDGTDGEEGPDMSIDPVDMEVDDPAILENTSINGGTEPEHRSDSEPVTTQVLQKADDRDDSDTICKPVWNNGIASMKC